MHIQLLLSVFQALHYEIEYHRLKQIFFISISVFLLLFLESYSLGLEFLWNLFEDLWQLFFLFETREGVAPGWSSRHLYKLLCNLWIRHERFTKRSLDVVLWEICDFHWNLSFNRHTSRCVGTVLSQIKEDRAYVSESGWSLGVNHPEPQFVVFERFASLILRVVG